MSGEIIDIILGRACPKCGSTRLYNLRDNRRKCADCKHRFSPKRIEDDKEILIRFVNEYPAHKAAKELGFSYNKVHNKYMQYRREILEYADKKNIPKQPSVSEINKLSEKARLKGFLAFAKEILSRYRRVSKNHLPLYQRELEFRYHYRRVGITHILTEIHFDILSQSD